MFYWSAIAFAIADYYLFKMKKYICSHILCYIIVIGGVVALYSLDINAHEENVNRTGEELPPQVEEAIIGSISDNIEPSLEMKEIVGFILVPAIMMQDTMLDGVVLNVYY